LILHIVTIFPEFFPSLLAHGVVGKAIESGLVRVHIHNLRDWTRDRHKTVDDRPFGGGEGMLLKCEPLFDAVESILPNRDARHRVLLLSASGRLYDQAAARRLSSYAEIVLLCGRYEGVDERVATHLADEELSIGDYVLSGGELPACVLVDSIARLVPGVVGNEASTRNESFTAPNRLDCPQYTRPAIFRGLPVPETLLSGNHEQIREWREQAALEKTSRNRPDLLDRF
jgi:tRNA (guanine37-N1)-methyltransferase